ncbi:hypothetical protein CTI12_AA610140 [Artemisia annua]|uniref:Uncharacterized protein n=1 Tax=Artemisia annua TaxID=35608 RepID=A0A2U1KF08_ARTAN|nr:hypothetical protein CTI12_AA610140 [Artemisia annua]
MGNFIVKPSKKHPSTGGDSNGTTSSSSSTVAVTENLKKFNYSELRKATRNFEANTRLGDGHFWSVFKGWPSKKHPSTGGDSNGTTSSSSSTVAVTENLKKFNYSELRKATRNFEANTRLGDGHFWSVFKGWIWDLLLSRPPPEVQEQPPEVLKQ